MRTRQARLSQRNQRFSTGRRRAADTTQGYLQVGNALCIGRGTTSVGVQKAVLEADPAMATERRCGDE